MDAEALAAGDDLAGAHGEVTARQQVSNVCDIDLVRGEFPEARIGLAPYLGLAAGVPELLIEQAAAAPVG